MIVEIDDSDIKEIGKALSKMMIARLNGTWQGAFGLTESSTPFEILKTLMDISNDDNSTDGQMAESFAAYLEVEGLGMLYTKLLTGNDYSNYLLDGKIDEFLDLNLRKL